MNCTLKYKEFITTDFELFWKLENFERTETPELCMNISNTSLYTDRGGVLPVIFVEASIKAGLWVPALG